MIMKVPYHVKHGGWQNMKNKETEEQALTRLLREAGAKIVDVTPEEDDTFICDICERRKKNNSGDILNCAGIVICADCDKKNKSD